MNFAYSDLNLFNSLDKGVSLVQTSWFPNKLGTPGSAQTYHLLFGLITTVFFGDIGIAQKVFWLSLQPFSGVTMYLLLSRSQVVKSKIAIEIASFFYSFNPISAFLFAIGVSPWLYLYALLPLIILSYIYLVNRGDVRSILFFSIVLAFSNFYNRDALLIVLPMAVLYFLISIFTVATKRDLLKIARSTAIGFILAFFLTSSYYIPLILSTTYQSIFSTLGSIPELRENVLSVYSNSGPENLLKLTGSHVEWLPSDFYGTLPAVFYLIPILAFTSLLIREKRVVRYVWFFFALEFSVITFSWLTKEGYSWILFERFPLLLVFRESYKLLSLTPLGYSFLIALTLDFVAKRMSTSTSSKIACIRIRKVFRTLSVVFILVIVLSQYPLILSGDELQGEVVSKRYTAFGGDYLSTTVPQAYFEIKEWIDEQRNSQVFFRSLWLPIDPHLYGVMQFDPYTLFPLGDDAPADELISQIFQEIITNGSNIVPLLSEASVRYVAVYKQSAYAGPLRSFNRGVVGDPKLFYAYLKSQNDLHLVSDSDSFAIFENVNFAQHIVADRPLFILSQNTDDYYYNLQYLDSLAQAGVRSQLVFPLLSTNLLSKYSGLVAYGLVFNPTVSTVLPQGIFETQYFVYNINPMLDLLNVTNWQKPAFVPMNLLDEDGAIAFGIDESKQSVYFLSFVVPENLILINDNIEFEFYGNFTTHSDVKLQLIDTSDGREEFQLNNTGSGWLKDTMKINAPTAGYYGFNSRLPLKMIRLRIETDGEENSTLRYLYLKNMHVLSNSALNGEYPADTGSKVFVPTSGFYTLTLNVQGKVQVSIDGGMISNMSSLSPEWIVTKPFYLSQGYHNLDLTYIGNLENIILFCTSPNNQSSSFNDVQIDMESTSSTGTAFKMKVISETPVLIQLNDRNDPGWIASCDGERLAKVESIGWANLFYLNKTGVQTVELQYTPQKTREIVLLIWIASWAVTITAFAYLSLQSYRRKVRNLYNSVRAHTRVTLEMIYDEVKRVNERLRLIKDIIEEVITKELPEVALYKEKIKDIERSIQEMKKGIYVTLEELKSA